MTADGARGFQASGAGAGERVDLVLLGAGALIVCAFGAMAWLHARPGEPAFMAALALASVGYVIALARLARRPSVSRRTLFLCLVLAFAGRAALLTLPDDQGGDARRYVWDARVQRAGLSPYYARPNDPTLSGLHTDLTRGVHAPWLPTIYPPVAQLYFRVVASVDESIRAFRVAAVFLEQWGREGDGPGEFRNPVGIAIGRDGAVYVSDYEQDRIQTFTATGTFLRAFGRSGSERGEFRAQADVTVDNAGSVYVADFYNHRVQKWRQNRSVERVIGHAGRLGSGALHYPAGVTLTADGELLVADAYNYQLQWFTPDGQFLRRVGYHVFWIWPRPVSSRSGFFVPTDTAVGPDGIIHVADSGNHRVVMLSRNGEYLTEWRIPEPDPNVFSPEHIAASPDGTIVYATDLAKSRVLVLRVGT
ncbi:MAG: hypothetical protein GEU99_16295 [Luteitalea sp.]|nr:hypothetical protein [Luteitalea sp.]